MRLRQVAVVAAGLQPTLDALHAALGVEVCFRDPGVAEFGLVNALLRVGDTFLEVVSPAQPGTTAGRFLERRGGDGGYMVLLETADLDADVIRTAGLGVRTAWSIDLPDIRARHLHPRDVGGAILSLDQPEVAGEWRWAGPTWRAAPTPPGAELVAVELQSEDPRRLAARWAAITAHPVTTDADGHLSIALDRSALRFVPAVDGRGEGLGGIDVALPALAGEGQVEVAGLRIRLVEPPP